MDLNQFVKNFADQLENEEAVNITAATEYKQLGEWDSLVMLSIIAMADEKYGVKINGDDFRNSTTIADLCERLSTKLA